MKLRWDYTNENLKFARSTDSGATWPTIQTVDSTGDVGRDTSIAVNGLNNKDYSVELEKDISVITFFNADGDWLSFNVIQIEPPEGDLISLIPGITDWGIPQTEFILNENVLVPVSIPQDFKKEYVEKPEPNSLEKWKKIESAGVPVMAGEWGVYNKTRHDATLRFMEYQLKKMKKAGLGWVLWNFRGPFGIIDSGREDVLYEDFNGYKLDRAMLEILQKY